MLQMEYLKSSFTEIIAEEIKYAWWTLCVFSSKYILKIVPGTN